MADTASRISILLIGALAGSTAWIAFTRNHAPIELYSSDAEPRPVVARGDLSLDEQTRVEIFQQVAPSVVHIRAAPTRLGENESTGTGFVWDANGYVVTNQHVVDGRQQVQVRFSGRREFPAQVVGVNIKEDIAVLKLLQPLSGLRPIPIGSSDDLRVGQSVFAIGNPFGLTRSLSAGIISALGRVIQSRGRSRIEGAIQTDAAINPGNSGGPLLDSAGLLIGMNTAIYSPSGTNAGIGFAIPADRINELVPDIIRGLTEERPVLGADYTPIDLNDGTQRPLITSIDPGSGASRAGLRAGDANTGDVILGIDGVTIQSVTDLLRFLKRKRIGDVVVVEVLRATSEGDERLKIRVRLSAPLRTR
ncbi:MAG: trypsin-like peptidase domain-containing protein [Planctomycetota bacterium]